MHRSRVGVILIDHAEAHEEALAFWTGVTGGRSEAGLGGSEFTELGAVGSAGLAVQRVGAGTPARVHLDIETDDVDAEVRRVLALGARLVDHREEHAILEDPGGLVFCVVPVQMPDAFDAEATTWD
jgi:catechol 2,3-dioxygenase-like lactoylglutathione lyase family enzyme